jgi:pilus assembly protein TadC
LPAAAAVATAVLAVLLGGWLGAAAALPLAAAAAWLVARLSRAQPADSPPEARSVALVADLLAGALAAGSPPELAIERVAAAVAEYGSASLRHAVEPLGRVGRLLRLGSEPATAWAALQPVPGYGPVADSGRRCASSGARLAQALTVTAAELRAAHQAEALARAERVGVWSLLPLGLCFLPAFVCLGVLPVILGVAGEVFGGVSE